VRLRPPAASWAAQRSNQRTRVKESVSTLALDRLASETVEEGPAARRHPPIGTPRVPGRHAGGTVDRAALRAALGCGRRA
jgi:hypothetical protein